MLAAANGAVMPDPDDPLEHLPPWHFLLDPMQRAWRESQLLKGRDPDPYIEQQLIEAGKWTDDGSGNP
jgi:hypothetical protein